MISSDFLLKAVKRYNWCLEELSAKVFNLNASLVLSVLKLLALKTN